MFSSDNSSNDAPPNLFRAESYSEYGMKEIKLNKSTLFRNANK